jgi:hypothetical protein
LLGPFEIGVVGNPVLYRGTGTFVDVEVMDGAEKFVAIGAFNPGRDGFKFPAGFH